MDEYVLKKDILKYLEKKSSIEISTNSVIGKDISRAIDALYCDIDNMTPVNALPVGELKMDDEKKAKLIKFIQDELCHAYCDNCRGNDEKRFEGCEDCHRKYIGWEVGLSTATRIAEKAIELFNEEDNHAE